MKVSNCSTAGMEGKHTLLQQAEQGGATANLWEWKGRAVPCLPAFPGSHIRDAHNADAISDAERYSQAVPCNMAKLLECPWRRCRLIPFLAVDMPCHQCKCKVSFGGVKSWPSPNLALTAGMRLRKGWARKTLAL